LLSPPLLWMNIVGTSRPTDPSYDRLQLPVTLASCQWWLYYCTSACADRYCILYSVHCTWHPSPSFLHIFKISIHQEQKYLPTSLPTRFLCIHYPAPRNSIETCYTTPPYKRNGCKRKRLMNKLLNESILNALIYYGSITFEYKKPNTWWSLVFAAPTLPLLL